MTMKTVVSQFSSIARRCARCGRTVGFALTVALCMSLPAQRAHAVAFDFTVTPLPLQIDIDEGGAGHIDFVIQNLDADFLVVHGYLPILGFLGVDRTDDFFDTILGPAIPYAIAPFGMAIVPVLFETPPADGPDTPLDFGAWSLALGVDARVGGFFGRFAFGQEAAAAIVVHDVPEPTTFVLLASSLLAGIVFSRLRRKRALGG